MTKIFTIISVDGNDGECHWTTFLSHFLIKRL